MISELQYQTGPRPTGNRSLERSGLTGKAANTMRNPTGMQTTSYKSVFNAKNLTSIESGLLNSKLKMPNESQLSTNKQLLLPSLLNDQGSLNDEIQKRNKFMSHMLQGAS